MIRHTEWFKLQEFKRFWEHELQLSPCARFKPRKHRYTVFDRHSRNMKRIGDMIMPKKKAVEVKFDWKGYVNIDVPETRYSELEKFLADNKQVFYQYNVLLTTNYQVKQYFDPYVEAIKTNVVCYAADSGNFGYALSSYADDWYTSLGVMCYKHFVYADGDWHSVASNKIKRFG